MVIFCIELNSQDFVAFGIKGRVEVEFTDNWSNMATCSETGGFASEVELTGIFDDVSLVGIKVLLVGRIEFTVNVSNMATCSGNDGFEVELVGRFSDVPLVVMLLPSVVEFVCVELAGSVNVGFVSVAFCMVSFEIV